jgi:quercetin dioxygenase-like cupin family protein
MAYTLIPDVAAEVDIPEDGTLSRVLHQSDPVRLVVFAFDVGQELTEHSAARAATIQVISGRIEMRVGGDGFEMSPGSWLLLEADEPHSLTALEPSVILLALLGG